MLLNCLLCCCCLHPMLPSLPFCMRKISCCVASLFPRSCRFSLRISFFASSLLPLLLLAFLGLGFLCRCCFAFAFEIISLPCVAFGSWLPDLPFFGVAVATAACSPLLPLALFVSFGSLLTFSVSSILRLFL